MTIRMTGRRQKRCRTAPAAWLTVANGKLIGVKDAGNGLKMRTWQESLAKPSSTYLITVVAGEFEEVKDSVARGPVTYYAPGGRGDRLKINYGRTPQMLELFSKKLGVEYPWEKYAQSMVDDFVAGGMEKLQRDDKCQFLAGESAACARISDRTGFADFT